MYFKTLHEITKKVQTGSVKRIVAVAAAEDEHVIASVIEAKAAGIADAILIGNAEKIKQLLKVEQQNPSDYNIVNANTVEEAAQVAVELVKKDEANFLMKGILETAQMLKPVVNKENDLHSGRIMSHLSFNHIPSYSKVITITDGAMMMYPTLEQKKQILQNAVDAFHILGYEEPKIACLCAIEKVNPKMPETLDAAALKEAAHNGEFGKCVVEGPISYDIAMDKEIAEIKGFNSPCCGDFDILHVPNIQVGNILGKSWVVSAKGTFAGVVVGARVPIVLTSRASSSQEKLLALSIAALLSGKK
ncbi:MAG: phosphate butyryltransferase [Firmicutes bacterium]|nr:phosphate butyryltransferase [Bacillota bacterium]